MATPQAQLKHSLGIYEQQEFGRAYKEFNKILKHFADSKEAPEAHTAQYIKKLWVEILLEWNILSLKDGVELVGEDINNDDYAGWDRIWGIVPDNGANINAAIRTCPQHVIDGSAPCIAHTGQLAVNSSIHAQ